MIRSFIKWRLIISTAPYAAGVLVLKLALLYVAGFEGLISIQEIRLIFTAGVFLTGFMVAGTLSDYKESERIPGRLASLLEAAEEIGCTLARQSGTSVAAFRQRMLALATSIYDWLYRRVDDRFVHDQMTDFSQAITVLQMKGGAPPNIGRLHHYLFELRSTVTRIDVISRTGFLPTGYGLMELLMVVVTILLLLAKFQSIIAMVMIVFIVELLYVYMYRLILDIDDPFEYEEAQSQRYDEAGQMPLTADVSLFPLYGYLNRLRARATADEDEDGRTEEEPRPTSEIADAPS